MNNQIKKQIELLDQEQERVKIFLNENGFDCTTAPWAIVKRYRTELKEHLKVLRINLMDEHDERTNSCNERIRELAEQSGLAELLWVGVEGHEDAVALEKFAELIVRECMDVARQQRNPANLNYKPSERFVEDLRKHFGVE